MSTNTVMIFCTCPDSETADQIANQLVAERLAACVNITPNIRSVYRWQGSIESATEQQLIIKSTSDRINELSDLIHKLHPYELPEILAVPIERGLPAYLEWIEQQTRPDTT